MLTFPRSCLAVVNFEFARAVCDPEVDETVPTWRRVAPIGAWARGTVAVALGRNGKSGLGVGSRAPAAPKCAEMAPVTWRERERDARVADARRRVTSRGPRRDAALRPRAHPDLDRGRARCRSGDGEFLSSQDHRRHRRR